MIDISHILFTKIKEAVQEKYPDCGFSITAPDSVSKFPFVTVEEIDNYSYKKGFDYTNKENYVWVLYEVNVYSNSTNGKVKETKDIMRIVDDVFISNRFERTMMQPVPNLERTIYRMYARYKAVVSADYIDENGNTVNQIYRR